MRVKSYSCSTKTTSRGLKSSSDVPWTSYTMPQILLQFKTCQGMEIIAHWSGYFNTCGSTTKHREISTRRQLRNMMPLTRLGYTGNTNCSLRKIILSLFPPDHQYHHHKSTLQLQKTVNYTNAALDNIRTTNFICYTKFQLHSDDQIMQFYCNIYTQRWQYWVYVKAIDNVGPKNSVAPFDLSSEANRIIDQILSTRFCQRGTINPSYTASNALFNSTRDGYEFLEQLLLFVYPKLASVR